MGETVIYYTRALPDTTNIRAEDLLKDESLPVPFIASTEGVKSDGKDLRMSDWILDRYQNYSPVLWVHDYMHPPLGTGEAEIGDKLRINVAFDTDDSFAMMIRSKAIKGMMGGSVGWAETKNKKNELVEFSMVPIGLDQESLPEIQRMGYRAMQANLSELLGESPGDSLEEYIKELRNEVMESILAILQEVVDEDEADVRGEEEIASEEMVEETIETPEPEDAIARAGAMLSKKNREDLQAALDLIKGIIERATPDEPVPTFSAMRGDEEEVEITVGEAEDGAPEEGEEEVVERGQDPNEGLHPEIVEQILEVLN